MVSEADALRCLYPSLQEWAHWSVDGTTGRLLPGSWRGPGDPPSPEALAAVTEEQVAAARASRVLDAQASMSPDAVGSLADPLPVGTAAGLLVARAGTMADRACLAQIAAAVARIEAHLGLTPSVVEVPPQLTVEECEGLRRQAVAALLGLPPMAREGP